MRASSLRAFLTVALPAALAQKISGHMDLEDMSGILARSSLSPVLLFPRRGDLPAQIRHFDQDNNTVEHRGRSSEPQVGECQNDQSDDFTEGGGSRRTPAASISTSVSRAEEWQVGALLAAAVAGECRLG